MEKQTVFIKRYPSKGELPKEHLHVIVFWNEEPLSSRLAYRSENGYWFLSDEPCDCDEPDCWLDEIELPSEDEVKAELTHPVNISVNVSTLLRDMYEHGVDRAYKFILNKLKGE